MPHGDGWSKNTEEDVAAVARGGLPIEQLARSLHPYEWATLDESLIEGEHRSLRVEAQRAHNVTHARAVATLRMKQNAALIQEAELVEGRAAAAECAWRRAKLLAAPPSSVGTSSGLIATQPPGPDAPIEARPTMLGPPEPLDTPTVAVVTMPAVATHAGARLFFGAGVVLVLPDAAVVVEEDEAAVHCFMRMDRPDNAVRPPPLPCTRTAGTARGRVAPGFKKN